ncbi:MAG: DsrE family protein [Candidatus Saliniplasma sp.]
MKVVFHLNEEEKTNEVLANIRNLKRDMDAVEVELLVNGLAVRDFVQGSNYESKIEEMVESGVFIKVCSNSLKGLRIEEEELLADIYAVPAGVSELVRKQEEGWSYIKP